MSARELRSGENVPVPSGFAHLTVTPAAVPLLIVQLTAADTVIGAATADGHSGVLPIVADQLPVTLTALDPAVSRCLLVAHGRTIGNPVVELATSDGQIRFSPTGPPAGPARVLVEFYLRSGGWKVRALGDSYAGGLIELGRAHGADFAALATAVGGPTAQSAAQSASPATGDAQPGQWHTIPNPQPPPDPHQDVERVRRHLTGIWEDAARSTIAYTEAVEFAEARRDRELEDLVATVQGRDPHHPGRAIAEQRCQDLIEVAAQRRLGDIDQLVNELRELEAGLPASVARWDSPTWQQPIPESGSALVRVGEITRGDSLALRIPMTQGIFAYGGLCLVAEDSTISPGMLAMLHRIFAAAPAGRAIEVIADDQVLATALRLPSAVGSTASRADRLNKLALAIDLAEMAASEFGDTGHHPLMPGVVVIASPAVGLSEQEQNDLTTITTVGPRFGVATVFLGAREQLPDVQIEPVMVPLVSAKTQDPWTGQVWDFEPDAGQLSETLGRNLRQRMGLSG